MYYEVFRNVKTLSVTDGVSWHRTLEEAQAAHAKLHCLGEFQTSDGRTVTAPVYGIQDAEVAGVPLDLEGKLPPKWERLLWDTFITAMEGGVDYWATRRRYAHKTRDDAPDDFTPTDYYAVISEDGSGGDGKRDTRHDINRAVMLRGFRVVLGGSCPLKDTHEQVRKIGAAWKDPEIEGDIDADGADILVQLALFGEVVYG